MASKQKPPVSKVKLALAALGVIYCVIFVVWAARAVLKPSVQRGPSELSLHPERADEIISNRSVMRFQKELNLTGEQVEKATAILTAVKKEVDALILDTQRDRVERLVAGRAKMQAAMSQVETILTDEQKVKFQELVARRQGRGGMLRNLLESTAAQKGQRSQDNASE